MQLTDLLTTAISRGAEVIHLRPGGIPAIRRAGRLEDLATKELAADETEAMVKEITPPRSQQQLQEQGRASFVYVFSQESQFRAEVFRTQEQFGLCLALIPPRIWAASSLGLNHAALEQILSVDSGLIIVHGTPASGKSTTMASIVDHINYTRKLHIATIENPIWYKHLPIKSVLTQRRVGVDTPSIRAGLRDISALDPDVIMIDEMRGPEIIEVAITAAEDGHLVLATFTASSAPQVINRLIQNFSASDRPQITERLSGCLKSLISQVLVPTTAGGRVAAFEVVPEVNRLLKHDALSHSDIYEQGMITRDSSLIELCQQGKITIETCIEYATDREKMELNIKM